MFKFNGFGVCLYGFGFFKIFKNMQLLKYFYFIKVDDIV